MPGLNPPAFSRSAFSGPVGPAFRASSTWALWARSRARAVGSLVASWRCDFQSREETTGFGRWPFNDDLDAFSHKGDRLINRIKDNVNVSKKVEFVALIQRAKTEWLTALIDRRDKYAHYSNLKEYTNFSVPGEWIGQVSSPAFGIFIGPSLTLRENESTPWSTCCQSRRNRFPCFGRSFNCVGSHPIEGPSPISHVKSVATRLRREAAAATEESNATEVRHPDSSQRLSETLWSHHLPEMWGQD